MKFLLATLADMNVYYILRDGALHWYLAIVHTCGYCIRMCEQYGFRTREYSLSFILHMKVVITYVVHRFLCVSSMVFEHVVIPRALYCITT